MTDFTRIIKNYGCDVNDIKTSPFEAVDMLHSRSMLKKNYDKLTIDEKIDLLNYDYRLIKNAKEMAHHISKVYDFSNSKEPLEEWWWHLDKVAKGELTIKFNTVVELNMAI